jgi:hypothetical protein
MHSMTQLKQTPLPLRIAFILACLLSITTLAASSSPHASYIQVRAYAYNREGDIDRPILKNGQLDFSVVDKRSVVLTAQQSARLIAAVTGKRPVRPEAMCFNPRHAFVFYDAAMKPVAWVELCFQCHNAEAEPQQKEQVYDVAALEKLARELKLPLVPQ